jgi:hypothetical protein
MCLQRLAGGRHLSKPNFTPSSSHSLFQYGSHARANQRLYEVALATADSMQHAHTDALIGRLASAFNLLGNWRASSSKH